MGTYPWSLIASRFAVVRLAWGRLLSECASTFLCARRLLACPPRVHRIPAPQARGVSERDWRFNRVADKAAHAAHFLRVPPGDRATRCEDLRAFAVVHDAFAAVEVAALVAKRIVRGAPPLPLPTWRAV